MTSRLFLKLWQRKFGHAHVPRKGVRASSLSAENVLPLTTSGDNETEVSLGQSLLLPSRAREERGAMPSDCSTCSGRLGGARGC